MKQRTIDLYQIKVTLKWSNPPIWRRLVVPADIRLDELHYVLQAAMGWTNSHLHQFIAGAGLRRTSYGLLDPNFPSSEMHDEQDFNLKDLAPAARRKITYEYDFGDGWQHEVLVEKRLPDDPKLAHPLCLGGEVACPPEDCGGIPGYYRLIEIVNNPKHPEHEEMKEWLGEDYDPAAFSVDAVNKVLKVFRIRRGSGKG